MKVLFGVKWSRVVLCVLLVLIGGCQEFWNRKKINTIDILQEEVDLRKMRQIKKVEDHNKAVQKKNDFSRALASRPPRADSGLLSELALSGRETPGSVVHPPGNGAATDQETRKIELDFQDISLTELVRLFFEDYLHQPYTILSNFKDKKVNFVFRGQVSKSELLRVFETFLGFHGVKLTYRQGVYAVGSGKSKVKSLPTTDSIGDSIAIFKLRYLNVKDFMSVARVFMSDPGGAVLLDTMNTLFVKAEHAQIEILDKLRKSLDVPYFEGKYLLVYAPRYLKTTALKALIGKYEFTLGSKAVHPKRRFEVEEIQGENRLLIVAADKEARDMMLRFLRVTDKPEANRRQMFQYPLANQIATEVLATVKNLLKSLVHDGATPTEVVADKLTNSLYFMVTPDQYTEIARMLRRLDYRIPEVHIDVLIGEVGLNDQLQYGIEYYLAKQSAANISDVAVNLRDAALVASGAGAVIGTASLINNNFATIQLLATTTDFKVLSNPHLLVKNGEKAHINVGQNIAVPTAQVTTNTAGSSQQTDFERHDVTINLEVTPRISMDGVIQLQIKLNDERLLRFDTINGSEQPVFSKREVQTDMVVDDNQTILLGGIIQRNTISTVQKIPWLGDLPYLGYLFRSVNNKEETSELFMMITPRLVVDKEGANIVTRAMLEAYHESIALTAEKERVFQQRNAFQPYRKPEQDKESGKDQQPESQAQ